MIVYKKIKDGMAVITPHGNLMGGSDSVILNNILLEIENNSIRECIIDFTNIKWINFKITNMNNTVQNYINMVNLSEYFMM